MSQERCPICTFPTYNCDCPDDPDTVRRLPDERDVHPGPCELCGEDDGCIHQRVRRF